MKRKKKIFNVLVLNAQEQLLYSFMILIYVNYEEKIYINKKTFF